ncbi:MAG: HAD-IA family hydrolase [Hadesarchaea archaeon]|nr:HAD-IA family hydrolase [Hadesarchaea archaeon]
MLKAVTFDMGGTLAEGGLDLRSYQTKLLRYLACSGFEVNREKYQEAMRSALEDLRKARERLMEVKFEEFYSGVLRALQVPPSPRTLEGIMKIYIENFRMVLKPHARDVLSELKKNYELGIISNSMSGLARNFLKMEGLSDYFKVIVISRDVGIRKPSPKVFHRALELLGVEPTEAAHVGNSMEEDVAGAKAAGMRSVLLSSCPIEDAEVEPDLTVPSLDEVPAAIATLASPKLLEIKTFLGNKCELCSSRGVGMYKIDPSGQDDVDNFVLLCPSCRKESLKEWQPRPRKHGKYRAIYRRAWLKLHAPKRD